MMTLKELGNFTLDELGDFTLDELSLSIDDFIAYIKDKNSPIPVGMYQKLLDVADKLGINTSLCAKSNMTVSDKITLIQIIIQIIIAILSLSGQSQANNTYNTFVTTQVQIQNLPEENNENVDDICDQILVALTDYKP